MELKNVRTTPNLFPECRCRRATINLCVYYTLPGLIGIRTMKRTQEDTPHDIKIHRTQALSNP